MIKKLAKNFKGQFEFQREETDKYMIFSLPMQKQNRNIKIMTYKIA